MRRATFACVLLYSLVAGPLLAAEPPVVFERDVRPILKTHCFHCHGEGDELKGSLDLRLRRTTLKGGDTGPAIVPGKHAESLLFERIEAGEMPPGNKPLPAAQRQVIARWIDVGAPTAAPEPDDVAQVSPIADHERQFWAFQPVVRPPVPQVKHRDRVQTPIDAFLLARLEAAGLGFSPTADRTTLLRRAHFDLTGLPPTPAETAAFLADERPDAFERAVDRLLDSPHYGERWGRHWLDVAGYADSDGYTNEDPVRKYSYKYRDYVIRSFNTDKPFDAFIQEQLAGDELVPQPYHNLNEAQIDLLVATGFLRTVADGTAGGGDKVSQNAVMSETIKVVSESLLGLTVGCAECHNHRYDPILQTDYYRFRAMFEPAYDWKHWRNPQQRLLSLYTDADRQRAKEVEADAVKIEHERLEKLKTYIEQTFDKELAKLPEDIRQPIREARQTAEAQRTPEQKQLLKDHPSVNVTDGSLYLYDPEAAKVLKDDADRAAKVRGTKPVEEFIAVLTEVPGQVPETFLFSRGDPDQPKQSLPPGELTVLTSATEPAIPSKNPSLPSTGRRLAYARHLTDGKHPLTARVLVNRLWMHHFGRGIVGTPGDFGALGEKPTHPELLDWLADEFVRGGWKIKRLHKLMLLSSAWQQSSVRNPAGESADPDNRFLWRSNVRRLEAEAIRDAILTVSGQLNPKLYGAAVPVMEDEVGQFVVGIENKNGEGRPDGIIPLHGEEFRRSIYVQVRRSRPLSVLSVFDLPAMEPHCVARPASTVAPQSLLMMNNDFTFAQAQACAARIAAEAGSEPAAQVALAWRLHLGRDITPDEQTKAVAFLQAQSDSFAKTPPPAPMNASDPKPDHRQQALALLCHALLSSNEFLYVD
jgi:hypothetical protein